MGDEMLGVVRPEPKSAFGVLVAGLVSTAVTLFVVYALSVQPDINVMGWYADYVLPAGRLSMNWRRRGKQRPSCPGGSSYP